MLDGGPAVLRGVAMATNFGTQFAITGFVGYNFGCIASDMLFDSRGKERKGKERKGKERKSIYIAPFRTKVHTKRSGMDHTVFTCKQHHACLSFVAFTRCRHHSN